MDIEQQFVLAGMGTGSDPDMASSAPRGAQQLAMFPDARRNADIELDTAAGMDALSVGAKRHESSGILAVLSSNGSKTPDCGCNQGADAPVAFCGWLGESGVREYDRHPSLGA